MLLKRLNLVHDALGVVLADDASYLLQSLPTSRPFQSEGPYNLVQLLTSHHLPS